MGLQEWSRLAWKHVRGAAAEELYLRGVTDVTRPVSVYAVLNEHCNYRCRYCEFWRLKEYVDEMSIDEWKAALSSVKDFIGHFHVEFSGGEPFIKKGFPELFKWCRDNDIGWGVVTNGSGLTPKMIPKIIEARPFNFNVSMDSHDPKVHNHTRGRPNSHAKVTKGLTMLMEARQKAGLDFPVILKPVVHKYNFEYLPDIVRWMQKIGPVVVNFQPVDRWTQETYDELWVEKEHHDKLRKVTDELIEMKAKGAPIMNSETVLNAFVSHFNEETAPPETMPCRVGLRNFFIRPNGNVEVCWSFPVLGNIKEKSAKEIWQGYEAKKIRKDTTECEKLCLFTCLSQKTLGDKAKMALTLLNRGAERFRGFAATGDVGFEASSNKDGKGGGGNGNLPIVN